MQRTSKTFVKEQTPLRKTTASIFFVILKTYIIFQFRFLLNRKAPYLNQKGQLKIKLCLFQSYLILQLDMSAPLIFLCLCHLYAKFGINASTLFMYSSSIYRKNYTMT